MSEGFKTILYDLHVANGAKMVSFANYFMPIQYREGIVKEHLWTRESASLFDVSHMGQILLSGAELATKLENLLPVDLCSLNLGQQRYALLLNEAATIEDDLMLTKRATDFYMVVNAACKQKDFEILKTSLQNVDVQWWQERALLALQGPLAADVLSTFNSAARDLKFMNGAPLQLLGEECWVSRSGYTGEDGFELSVPNSIARQLSDKLLADERVKLAGLGARDSLRLEAGLCLYGNDINLDTNIIEANLLWSIQKVRRPEGARAGGYRGAANVAAQIAAGATRKRVGFVVDGKIPVRPHSPLFLKENHQVGEVSSGGFAPSLAKSIGMAYVDVAAAAIGTQLFTFVRNKKIIVTLVELPFIKKDYKK